MGMGINSQGSRGRRAMMSEINVTPLVDVMLVLLIIFMVTAPLMTVGIPVDLPETNASPLNDQKEPLVITVNGQGKIYLQETEVALDQLAPRLRAITGENPNAPIYVRGDKTIRYGHMVQVMGTLSMAGFAKVALLADFPKTAPSRK